jgi:hypothetical protein
MTQARVRPELFADWADMGLRNLEGEKLNWVPKAEWVTAVCCDVGLGVYVLTEDDDYYFTTDSIDLEFRREG